MGRSSSLVERFNRKRNHLIKVNVVIAGRPLSTGEQQDMLNDISDAVSKMPNVEFISGGLSVDLDINGEDQ